ncbi:MAG TPA: polysaccharide deacetylase family protein [Gammaproteobacteria bacterium]|nr:polysaccharide deacetylase family protein [Gammaproteobacteria bacterium]
MKLFIYGLILIVGILSVPAMAADQAVVFMYHRFGVPQYPSTNVTPEQFAAHLDYLDDNGFQVWPLPKIVSHLQTGKAIPEKTVAITVDDAYRSIYEVAYPMLKAHGFPFTVFVSTAAVDKGLADYLSWEQMREMQQHGASFANHTVNHPFLLKKKPGESKSEWLMRVRTEVVEAQARLQAELGDDVNESPRLFAWPYGEYNTALAEVLDQMGYVAFGQQSGVVSRYGNLRALPRYPMAEAFADLDSFALKANSHAMPVVKVDPWDPLAINQANPPRLKITLDKDIGRLSGLACYIAGERVIPEWIDEHQFVVSAASPLTDRRSRYNCTAPAGDGDYYWYSHLWIRK